MKYCNEFVKDFDLRGTCCTSCHEDDEEFGMEMCYIEAGGEEYYVCCAVVIEYEND
jgi:hypothetical protein